MPNHVTHRVVVKGPAEDIRRFAKRHVVEDDQGEDLFDFERIIPMPKELDVEMSSHGRIGYAAWYGPERGGGLFLSSVESILESPWAKDAGLKTRKELQEYLKRESPEYKKQADIYKANIDKYGFLSSYEWSIANWGTKWNSYNFGWVKKSGPKDWGRTTIEFLFDTAWSPPEPIFAKISELFPSLKFDIASFDEGWGYACEGTFKAGESTYECMDTTAELYERVYGHKPSEPEPAEEEAE